MLFRVDRLNELMDAGGWSTSELANASGLNYHYVYRLRRGAWDKIGAASVAALAQALNTSTDYLLDLTDQLSPPPGLSIAESRVTYETAGAEDDDVRHTIASVQRLSPEQRAIIRSVADQMATPSAPRIIGQSQESDQPD